MTGEVPWYVKPWQKSRPVSRGRARLSVLLYLFTAVVAFGLALTTSSTGTRVMWVVVGLVWAFLGTSLLATQLWRSRSGIGSPTE
jgi:hypothetical protein